MNDSSEEDINTFLIVVSVLLTVSKLSVVVVLELVLVTVFDVDELWVFVTRSPKFPCRHTSAPRIVSDV